MSPQAGTGNLPAGWEQAPAKKGWAARSPLGFTDAMATERLSASLTHDNRVVVSLLSFPLLWGTAEGSCLCR